MQSVSRVDDEEFGTTAGRSRRRPADIFIPRAEYGTPSALGFACTSGLRADRLWDATEDPEAILAAYGHYKKDFYGCSLPHSGEVAALAV